MSAENISPDVVQEVRESVNVTSKVVQATEEQKQAGHAETFTVREAQPKPPQGNLVPALAPSPAAVAPVSAEPRAPTPAPESTPPLYGGTYGSAPPANQRPMLRMLPEEEQCNCCDFVLAVILAFLLTVATLSILGYPVEEWAGVVEYGESFETDSFADSRMEVCAPGDAMCVARNAQRTADKALREIHKHRAEHKAMHKPFEDLKRMLDGVGALAKPFVKQMQKEMAHQKRAQQKRQGGTVVCIPLPRKQPKCRRRVDPRICQRLQRAQCVPVVNRPVSKRQADAMAQAVVQHMEREMRQMEGILGRH